MRQTRRPLPSQRILREILDYDPITGALVWKKRKAKHYATADPEKSARTFNENHGRGGNQSNRVKLSCYRAASVKAIRR